MARTSIPRSTEEEVLIRSRRRCCVCYGLHRDSAIRRGQIAHINQDASDNRPGNLVFLCFDHHDEFDSGTSQSKGLTANELRRFRTELDDAIEQILLHSPLEKATEEKALTSDPHGLWVRRGANELGQMRIMVLSDGRYHVDALAFWGTEQPGGPNMGLVNFTVDVQGGSGEYVEDSYDRPSRILLEFVDVVLYVKTENAIHWGGLNAFFDGKYNKVSEDPFDDMQP